MKRLNQLAGIFQQTETNSYSVRTCNPIEEQSEILGLWNRNLPSTSPLRFEWLYKNGPATPFVLVHEADDIVGSAGMMKRSMRVHGTTVKCGQWIDLNIDQKHRSLSQMRRMRQTLDKIITNDKVDLLYAFPQPRVARLVSRLGYEQFGQVVRWVKPLRIGYIMENRIRNGLLRRLATGLLDGFWRFNISIFSHHLPNGMHFEVVDDFDSSFDDLWNESAERFPIAGERSVKYLKWRFKDSPEIDHQIACLRGSDGSLLAYIVYSIQDGKAHVDDFLFAEPKYLDLLLAQFTHLMRQQSVSAVVVVCLGTPETVACLKRFGFWNRSIEWLATLYANCPHITSQSDRLLDQNDWFLTRADIDTDL